MDKEKKWDKIRDVFKENGIYFITFMDMPNSELTTAMLGFKHPDNEIFKKFRFPVVSTNDPDDFVKSLKQAAFEFLTTNTDKYCRDAIRNDISLLKHPLKILLNEAETAVHDFTRSAFKAQESLAKEFLKDADKNNNLEGLQEALVEFKKQYENGDAPDVDRGPWSVNIIGCDDIIWEIEYDRVAIASYCIGASMEREAKISDELYQNIVKTVQFVYPYCKMSKDDQKAIKKNQAKGR